MENKEGYCSEEKICPVGWDLAWGIMEGFPKETAFEVRPEREIDVNWASGEKGELFWLHV